MTDTKSNTRSLNADRAAGVLLGTACGDALGAGYEFAPARVNGEPVEMAGGGPFNWNPGEWTDDTSMAIVIAQVAALGADLREPQSLDGVVREWARWATTASDVGLQTRAVLTSAGPTPTAATAVAAAEQHHASTGRSAGNGSLMRTAPVALAYLDDPDALDDAARVISALTHADPEAGEACALWCHAIAHAVQHGSFDGLRLAVARLAPDRAAVWTQRLDAAEQVEPHEIANNGWVVAALQAAWSAIVRTPVPAEAPSRHFAHALEAAVRSGADTDTVAAIAGGLLGARWGASAVPLAWQRVVAGWPGLRARDLSALALLVARRGQPDSEGWPLAPTHNYCSYGDTSTVVVHPHDAAVILGGVSSVRDLPPEVTAVVSLCRLGSEEVPASTVSCGNHVEVWLIDSDAPGANPHLDRVLVDAADTVAALRAEGHTVLLHCVQAHSRTPTVAALYASRHLGVEPAQALLEVCAALPNAHPNMAFLAALNRLASA